ncbi:MAG: ABC transporter permease [Lentisphaerae bacterium]|nr:ABC transporter permease [Lentisphaerota bacterium]
MPDDSTPIRPPHPVTAWLHSPFVRAMAALLLVVALGLIFNANGAFFKWHTHRDMFRYVAVFGILSCGMTLVIVTGGIDLSVGSMLGVAAVAFSLMVIHWGWPPWLAVCAVLAAGSLGGLAAGGLIARFRVQPFIATLALMVLLRGLAKWISGGRKISTAVRQADGAYRYVDVPAAFNFISSKLFHDNVAVVTLIFLACIVVCWVILARLRWGRYFYAVGGNEEAARYAGVPVAAVKWLAYGLCGFFSAVAGICQAAQEQQGDPEAGLSYELTAIAMVVIGGTRLNGGAGGIGLTLLGVLTIGYLEKILSINAVGEATRLMLTGLIIIGAVLFQRTRK